MNSPFYVKLFFNAYQYTLTFLFDIFLPRDPDRNGRLVIEVCGIDIELGNIPIDPSVVELSTTLELL